MSTHVVLHHMIHVYLTDTTMPAHPSWAREYLRPVRMSFAPLTAPLKCHVPMSHHLSAPRCTARTRPHAMAPRAKTDGGIRQEYNGVNYFDQNLCETLNEKWTIIWISVETHFWSRIYMISLPKKYIIRKKWKYRKKQSHVYLHILCAHATFNEKLTFFVFRIDLKSLEKIYFYTGFYLFK
jgi:hypothetical protein